MCYNTYTNTTNTTITTGVSGSERRYSVATSGAATAMMKKVQQANMTIDQQIQHDQAMKIKLQHGSGAIDEENEDSEKFIGM